MDIYIYTMSWTCISLHQHDPIYWGTLPWHVRIEANPKCSNAWGSVPRRQRNHSLYIKFMGNQENTINQRLIHTIYHHICKGLFELSSLEPHIPSHVLQLRPSDHQIISNYIKLSAVFSCCYFLFKHLFEIEIMFFLTQVSDPSFCCCFSYVVFYFMDGVAGRLPVLFSKHCSRVEILVWCIVSNPIFVGPGPC